MLEPGDRRYAVLADGSRREFRQLGNGDIFRLFESTGESVDDGRLYMATSDAVPDENDIAVIRVEVYTEESQQETR